MAMADGLGRERDPGHVAAQAAPRRSRGSTRLCRGSSTTPTSTCRSPHGLEQYGGGAWGLRDVCQGPVELLSATGRHAAIADVLRVVYANQERTTGDWPQWFMIDRYREVRAPDSHGDIVVWPIKALCDYLEATGDLSILDERVGYADDPGVDEPLDRPRPAPGRPDRVPVRPRDRAPAVRQRGLGGHPPACGPRPRGTARSAAGPSSSRTRRSAATGSPSSGAAGRRIPRSPRAWPTCVRGCGPTSTGSSSPTASSPGSSSWGRTARAPAPPARPAHRGPLSPDPDDPRRDQRHVHAGPGPAAHDARAATSVVPRWRAPDGPADGLSRRDRDPVPPCRVGRLVRARDRAAVRPRASPLRAGDDAARHGRRGVRRAARRVPGRHRALGAPRGRRARRTRTSAARTPPSPIATRQAGGSAGCAAGGSACAVAGACTPAVPASSSPSSSSGSWASGACTTTWSSTRCCPTAPTAPASISCVRAGASGSATR